MAKIPLRAYIEEIDTIIEHRQTEEAIAHCRYILKNYPKHIETYSLLGKAYLESQRYGNAADIFQRVLSSVPDDFISHVGMSIIREDENNLDAAIWHMERAFESQPYNAAIQGELRRLFGRRDGMEPPKVHLTRGALARMYAKGNLYQQAIAELRAALAEDPQRFDLQVILAQMYDQSGQNSEAIKIASDLIIKLPYCLEANRILTRLLPDTDRAEEAAMYQKRIEELVPYAVFADSASMPSEHVPQQAILLEQLIWDGDATLASEQTDWSPSTDDAPALSSPGLPEWTPETSEDVVALPATLDEDSDGDNIPDWMKDAGWGPSSGQFDESQSTFTEDEPASEDTSEAVAGELPDWLEDIAPPGAIDGSEQSDSEISDVAPTPEDLPDWLAEEGGGESNTIITWLEDKNPDITGGEAPDSEAIKAGGAAVLAGAAAAALSSSDEDAEPEADLPDEIETGETPAGETPDWLQETEQAPAASPDWLQATEEDLPDKTPSIEEAEINEQALPDWLGNLEGGTDNDETSPEASDKLPDWLQETDADSHAISPETEIDEAASDWIAGETDFQNDGLLTSDGDAAAAMPAELPDWLQESQEPEEEATPIDTLPVMDIEEAIPDRLDELVEDTASEQTLLDSSSEDEFPDWLADLGEEAPAEDSALEDSPTPAEEPEGLPDWLQDTSEVVSTDALPDDTEAAPEEPALDWLANLGEEAPAKDGALEDSPTPAEEPEGLPDWLQDTSADESSDAVTDTPDTASEATAPDWLADLGEDAAGETIPDRVGDLEEDTIAETDRELPPVDEAQPGELPDWLQEAVPEIDTEPHIEAPTDEDRSSELPDWMMEGAAGEHEDDFESVESEDTSLPTPEIPDPAKAGLIGAAVAGISEVQDAAEPAEPEPISPINELEESDKAVPQEVDFEDPEAAMAWLDDLAAKGGISDDELVSSPEEQSEPPSEMISETIEEAVTTAAEDITIQDSPPPAEEPEALPDWLQEVSKDETIDALPDDTKTASEEPTLDWLADLSGEPVTEDITIEDSLHPTEEAEALPDWLQEVSEDESADALPDATGTTVEETATDWLADLSKDTATELPIQDPVDEAQPGELPDWLQEAVADTDTDQPAEASAGQASSSELPDWVVDSGVEASEEDQTTVESEDATDATPEISDAVQAGLTGAAVAGLAELLDSDEPDEPVEIEPISDLDVSDESGDVTLQAEASTEAAQEPAPELPADEVDFEDADAAMAWLESLAAKQGVSEDELLTSPEERSETPPEWVSEITEEEPDTTVVEELTFDDSSPPADEPEDLPDVLQETGEDASEEPTTDWPADLSEQDTTEDTIIDDSITPAEEPGSLPDWLQEVSTDEAGIEQDPVVGGAQPGELPDWLQDAVADTDTDQPVGAPTVQDSGSELPDWVVEIAAEASEDDQISVESEDASDTTPEMPDAVQAGLKGAAVASIAAMLDSDESDEPVEIEPIPDLDVSDESDDELLQAEVPTELAQEPSTELPADKIDFEDADAAMAWLENLAAKQGVSEDELLSKPEDRSEIPPDWILENIVEEADESPEDEKKPTTDELPEWLEEIPEKQAGTTEQRDEIESISAPTEVSTEEIPDWLQDIGDDVPAIAGDTETAPTPVAPVEDDIPDWIQDIADEKPLEQTPEDIEIPTPEDEIVATIDDRDVLNFEDQQIPVIDVQEPAETLEDEVELVAPGEFEDADAAMAWLESLAAKQGVSEDELLSSPEERSETPPDWVQEAVEEQEEASVSEVVESLSAAEAMQFEPIQLSSDQQEIEETTEPPADQSISDADLQDVEPAERVADSPPASSEETPQAADLDEDDELIDAALEAVLGEMGVEFAELQTEAGQDDLILPPPGFDEEQDEIGSGEPDLSELPDADSAVAWLSGLAEEQESAEEEAISAPVQPDDLPLPSDLPADEQLPDTSSDADENEGGTSFAPPTWVTDGAVPEPEDEEYAWLTSDSGDTLTAEEDLIDLNDASLIQLERLPGIGFRRAQSITNYRDERGQFESIDDLLNVPGMDESTFETLKAHVGVKSEEVEQPEPLRSPEITLITPTSDDASSAELTTQVEAQNLLTQGDIAGALEKYNSLIQQGQRLDAVIDDLTLAADQVTDKIAVFKTLGDAHMQAGDLQAALDAYTRAEELLR